MTPSSEIPVSTALPPRAQIEAAVRLATERFAAELNSPSGQVPDWSQFQWTMARAAAVMHGVAPLLASGWQIPDHWTQFATQQQRCTAIRLRRARRALTLIDRQARLIGLPVMALKGSALHTLGLYRVGQRPMADIDLLVAPTDSIRMRQLLEKLGFGEVSNAWKHWAYEARPPRRSHVDNPPLGERADASLKIDLHQRIAEALPIRQIDITEKIWPCEPQPGLNAYPSILALMLHLLIHAAGNMANLGLRLIHVHDLALVAARLQAADWNSLIEQRVSGVPLWWALPPLELVHRYYPGRVPLQTLMMLRALCPRSLRRRGRRQTISDTSYCNLRLPAFPGLPWAVPLADKLDYIRARVFPNRDIRLGRTVTEKESWASGDTWVAQQSQYRRVLRWLLSSPIRPPSKYLVSAAIRDQAAHAAPMPLPADVPDVAAQMP